MPPEHTEYAARLSVDYPERLNRLTTLLRIVWTLPVGIILVLLAGGLDIAGDTVDGESRTVGGSLLAIEVATALMILVRKRYPRWWFDFQRELVRFQLRVSAYLLLLTDRYPSTVDEQGVHLEIDYPHVERDLNRWLPLVKWLLAIPHLLVLAILGTFALLAVTVAWFSILLTARYPESLFRFVVGVSRWAVRVQAYAFLLVTDEYPPFSLQ